MAKAIVDKPIQEVVLRRYEKPGALSERELVKRVCLSLGLLNPGDSRDVVVDILYVFLKRKKNFDLSSLEKAVYRARKMFKRPQIGITPSNITRQLRKLRELQIIERADKLYKIRENLSLSEIFESKIERILIEPTIERIKEYLALADEKLK
jgi:DNA-binding MarR family transcriptional regulator